MDPIFSHFRNVFVNANISPDLLRDCFVQICQSWPDGVAELVQSSFASKVIVGAVQSVPGGPAVIPSQVLTRNALMALCDIAAQREMVLDRSFMPREFLVLGPGCFGRGVTLKAARLACKQANGGALPARMIGYSVPVDTWVTNDGALCWHGDKSEGSCLGEV